MKWWMLLPAIPVAALLIVFIVGILQPARHSVRRVIHLQQPAEKIFSLLDNIEDLPGWSSTVERVEHLPDRDGNRAARVTLKWGGRQMVMTQLERTPPQRLVVSMGKEGGSVLGTWTHEITSENGGCRVALTEEGELKNPIFRVMARMRGLDGNISATLHDLARKFGESVEVRAE